MIVAKKTTENVADGCFFKNTNYPNIMSFTIVERKTSCILFKSS